MKVAVTGSSGFVGSALAGHLRDGGHDVVPISRTESFDIQGVEGVVHLAGLAHRTGRQKPPDSEYYDANYELTRKIVDLASASGIKRFVFLSSVSVVAGHNGVLSPDLPPNPRDAYGASKAKAETYLQTRPEIGPVILRPPLVYGADAKGNLGALRRLALSPFPLPFGRVDNRRTMVSRSNLVSAIEFLLQADKHVENQVFHVTDGRDLSLREIVSKMREGASRAPNLVSIPPSFLSVPLRAAGMSRLADQLLGDLIVDGTALNEAGWKPPFDPERDLLRMGRGAERLS